MRNSACKLLYAITMFGVVCWGAGQARAAGDAAGDLRQSLLEANQATVKATKNVDIKLTLEEMSGNPAGSKERSIYGRFIASNGKYGVWAYNGKKDYEDNRPAGYTLFDGTYLLSVTPGEAPGRSAVGEAYRCESNENGPDSRVSEMFLGWIAQGIDPSTILANAGCVVKAEPVEVEGKRTYEVNCKVDLGANAHEYDYRYWLAPDLSGNPVKAEVYSDGKLFLRMQYGDFAQLSNGVWFPKTLHMTRFGQDGAVDTESTLRILDIQVDPKVDDTMFSTSEALKKLPVGYYIDDHVLGMDYVLGASPIKASDLAIEGTAEGASESSAEAAGRNAWAKAHPTAATTGAGVQSTSAAAQGRAMPSQAKPQASRAGRSAIGTIIAVAAVLVAVMVKRRKR